MRHYDWCPTCEAERKKRDSLAHDRAELNFQMQNLQIEVRALNTAKGLRDMTARVKRLLKEHARDNR